MFNITIDSFATKSKGEQVQILMARKMDEMIFEFIYDLQNGTASLSEHLTFSIGIDNFENDISRSDIETRLKMKGVKDFEIKETFEYGITTAHVTVFNEPLINQFYNA